MNNRFVNLDMMANPLNWVTLALWLFVLGFVIHTFGPMMPKPPSQ
jgi:hypothetical protein